jgi:hypothetical protein
MSTTAQIKANQQNAQFSTGPTSAAGSERSSRNALRHGYTGQTLVLMPEEAEAYAAHVELYMNRHQPVEGHHRQLVQQLADADWGVHQIFTAQTAQISLLNVLTLQLSEAGADVASIIKSSAQCARTLATLTSYENRKRRTGKLIEEQLHEMYQRMLEELEAANSKETKDEPEIGFVHPDPAGHEPPASQPDAQQAWLRRQTAGMTVEEALKFAKSRR